MVFLFEATVSAGHCSIRILPVGAAASCICQYVQANKKSVYGRGRAGGDGGRFDSTV